MNPSAQTLQLSSSCSYVSIDKPFTILEDETIRSYIDLVKKPEQPPAEEPPTDAPAPDPAADGAADAMDTEG